MKADAPRQRLLGLGAGMLAVLIWSAWTAVSRLAVTGALSPYDVAAVRFFVAGFLLLPVVLRQGLGLGVGGWRGVGRAILLTAMAGAPYSLLAYVGLRYAPVSHAAILVQGVTPLCSAALGWLVLGEALTPFQLAGFALILLGVALTGWGGLDQLSAAAWFGDLLFLAMTVMWAVYTVAIRVWRVRALNATAVVSVGSLAYLPIYLLFSSGALWQAPWQELLLQAVYQGLLMSIAGLLLFTLSVTLLGVAQAAALNALVPALTVLIAVPVLGELPGRIEVAGLAVVSAGLALVVAWPRRGRAAAAAT